MKKLLILCFISSTLVAQTNTEIFLYSLSKTKETYSVEKGKNISNNPGYDSQPHFYSKNELIFSSTRNKQTDIAAYQLKTGALKFINNTPNGGEYSPQRIPNSRDISAVRLDTDGLQRFYKYDYKTGSNTEIIANLKVAYPMWYDKNTTVNVVIVGNDLDLIVTDIRSKKHTTIQKKVGRSVHAIPSSKLVSFISKANKDWEIWSLNPKTGETKKIINTLNNKEDICWLPNGTILLANGSAIMKFNPKTDTNWSVFHDFSKENHKNISRIIVNKKGNLLALVTD